MDRVYPLTPEERLLSTILNTGVKLHPGKEKGLRKTMEAMLKTLPPREHQVLRSRFGIGDHRPPKPLAEIGKEFNVTRERIRQIEGQALNQLRLPDRIQMLKRVFDLSQVRSGSRRLSAKAQNTWGPPNP